MKEDILKDYNELIDEVLFPKEYKEEKKSFFNFYYRLIGYVKYLRKLKFNISTHIDKKTISAGYGILSNAGAFKYPLGSRTIQKIFKTLIWKEYIENLNK